MSWKGRIRRSMQPWPWWAIALLFFVENVLEVEEESIGKLYFHILLNLMFTDTFQPMHIL